MWLDVGVASNLLSGTNQGVWGAESPQRGPGAEIGNPREHQRGRDKPTVTGDAPMSPSSLLHVWKQHLVCLRPCGRWTLRDAGTAHRALVTYRRRTAGLSKHDAGAATGPFMEVESSLQYCAHYWANQRCTDP